MRAEHNKLKKVLLNGTVILSAIVVVAVMVGGYLGYVQRTEQARVDQVVRESAVQSVALINERIHNDMNFIIVEAEYIGKQQESINSSVILQHVHERKRVSKSFKEISVVTPEGDMYNFDGTIIGNISSRSYFKRAMQGENVISNIERSMDGKDIISVAAPIQRGGEVIGIVNGRFLMSSLTKFLSAEFFGGRGYSYMANANGNVFVMSDHPDADPNFTNIYNGFNPAPSVSDEALETMLTNMSDGKEGRISYEWGGEKRTMSYMPVGINDWYLLSVLPNEIVASRAMEFTQQVFILTGALILVLALLVCYAYSQRKKARKSLETMHNELLTIYNTIPGGVFKCLVDDGFTVKEANDGFYKFLGYTREQFQEQYASQLVRIMRPEDVKDIMTSVSEQIKSGKALSNEIQLLDAHGVIKWILVSGEIVQQQVGEDLIYSCFTDVSELKRTQEELRDAKQRYDLIMAETQNIIFELNPIDRTITHSKMYEKKFGNAPITADFPQSVIDGHIVYAEDEKAFLDIYRRIERGDKFSSDEIRVKKADDSYIWCRVSATAVRDEYDKLRRVVGVIEDIDNAKRKLQEITEIARRDTLTGLYNKMTTENLIEKRLSASTESAALLVLDIDDFKSINDTLGHESGDKALVEVSGKLKRLFRTSDIVGRIGGDEFVVFLEGMEQGHDLEQRLLDISVIFGGTLAAGLAVPAISCSIGVAIFPQDGRNFAELFHGADMALYYVKQHGKNGVSFTGAREREPLK